MEALILILIEGLATLLAPLAGGFLTLVGSALSAALSLVIDVLGWAVERYCGRRPVKTPSTSVAPATTTPTAANVAPTAKPRRRRWTRWLLYATSGTTAAVLLALVVINLWFIDDLARWLLDKQRERSGIAITAATIEGNLFTGRFQASDIIVRRIDHPAGLIDLTARRLEAQISVWQVFADPLEVQSLTVDGIRGRFERGVPGQAPVKKKKKGASPTDKHKAKRPFVINSLAITDVEVAYADHTRKRLLALPVVIQHLTADPLRSQWAVFDVLFRAKATGSIAGRPFHITTTGDDLGRETAWHVDGLPVEILADQIGGPFALLSGGTCDVNVTDRWRMSQADRMIVMDWSVVLNQVKAEVPEDASAIMALLAKPAVAFINAQGERVPLSFRVEIDENRFDGAASAEAAGLWEVVSDSAAATLAKALGLETDSVKDTGDVLLDKAKEALDKWRKKKD